MTFHSILNDVANYYSDKLRTHGPTSRGVDWNTVESQHVRFEQLLKVCDTARPFSLIDYGCGYGALAHYLHAQGAAFQYYGYDIAHDMVEQASAMHQDCPNCAFTSDVQQLAPADYTVASGIFNVRLQTSDDAWKAYLLDTLHRMDALSTRGFAFNALTAYSDPEHMRADLYYADPHALFDYCKRNMSRYVALLHDYPLYEFTLLVRKPQGEG